MKDSAPACFVLGSRSMTLADDLRALLAAYEPAPDEREALAAMHALLDRGAAAFDRERFEPGHFTASAFVTSPAGDELLLIEHATLGRWLQPGGHIEPHDASALDAARRELAEETGLVDVAPRPVLHDIDVHAIPAGKRPAHRHFDVRFLFRAATRELAPSSEVRAARWVPLAGVSAVESDASVMRAVRKIVASRG